MAKITEQFTVDNGAGNGYTVYYKKGNACFYYNVSNDQNGKLLYSRTKRIKRAEFEAVKRNV